MMSVIERSIQVSYQLRVYFTQAAFDPANLVVQAALSGAESNRPHKALVVMDEALAQAQPDLPGQIENYFAAHAGVLALVCPPIIIEGASGRRTPISTSRKFTRTSIATTLTGIATFWP